MLNITKLSNKQSSGKQAVRLRLLLLFFVGGNLIRLLHVFPLPQLFQFSFPPGDRFLYLRVS